MPPGGDIIGHCQETADGAIVPLTLPGADAVTPPAGQNCLAACRATLPNAVSLPPLLVGFSWRLS
jgi:hypothetical protein